MTNTVIILVGDGSTAIASLLQLSDIPVLVVDGTSIHVEADLHISNQHLNMPLIIEDVEKIPYDRRIIDEMRHYDYQQPKSYGPPRRKRW